MPASPAAAAARSVPCRGQRRRERTSHQARRNARGGGASSRAASSASHARQRRRVDLDSPAAFALRHEQIGHHRLHRLAAEARAGLGIIGAQLADHFALLLLDLDLVLFGNVFDAFDAPLGGDWGSGSYFSSWTLPQLVDFTDWFTALYDGSDVEVANALLALHTPRITADELVAAGAEGARAAIAAWWPLPYSATEAAHPRVSDAHLYDVFAAHSGAGAVRCRQRPAPPHCTLTDGERVTAYVADDLGRDLQLPRGTACKGGGAEAARFEALYEWLARPRPQRSPALAAAARRSADVMPAPLLRGVPVLGIHFQGGCKPLICTRALCAGVRAWAARRPGKEEAARLAAVATCCAEAADGAPAP